MFTRVSSLFLVAAELEAGVKALEVLTLQAAMKTASALGWKAMMDNVYCNEVITTVQCNLIACEEHCERAKACVEAVSLAVERNLVRGRQLS